MTNRTVSIIAIITLTVVGIAVFMLLATVIIVLLACGQYRPPMPPEEDEEVMDTIYVAEPDSVGVGESCLDLTDEILCKNI